MIVKRGFYLQTAKPAGPAAGDAIWFGSSSRKRWASSCARRGRRNNTHYIVSALGLFDVASPEMFLAEQALWPAVMKELPEGAVFDQGLPKPQGELLVAGHAKTPSGSPTRAMMLEIVLGTIGKRVAVFGDRYWRPGAGGFVFTEPQQFSEMQIDLRRMYGGADHPQNTLGTGYQ